ncbi:MAG: CapA family protein [Thermoanaerobaculaceae bacterium]|nr:CapA family protein [Thermoanaerobaculaceae bacterium]MDI9621000.1 CapA family protein [Acidobacteriota bacterium]NLH12127.1 CapA family protein [Holophagae bacterium]HPW56678.1 CapA family protein [Thermoanaerobaculaceae bacterium]
MKLDSSRIARLALGLALAAALAGAASAQTPPEKLTWDQSKSVYNRRIHPPLPPEKVDWEGRVTALLREEPGDVIVTAVGDMIFNEQISNLPDPEHRQLFRLMQEADIGYGNLEFSINEHPEAQRSFYNFRAPIPFAWEVAAIGINMVSLANNHALDFGPDGLRDCLKALDRAQITYAGAGMTLADARAVGNTGVQAVKTKFGLLSYLRYWTQKYRCKDPSGPCLATINPASILVAKPDGTTEAVEGLMEDDVKAMEDDIVLAKRHNNVLMVSLHNHDVSHHRAYGIQDTTPANDQVMFHRAVDAGADLVLGSGPHVLRGIEIRKGVPIFYSLSNFIYQYRTPERIPIDLIHQRDQEIARPTNVSVWDRRDPERIFEGVLVRMTINAAKLRRIELIPFTIDDEGPLYGVPRLARTERGRQIIELMQKLSAPYATTIVDKGWYAEVKLL